MTILEQALLDWQKEQSTQLVIMMENAIDVAQARHDIVKQKHCAAHFNVSVNTLKDWVVHGCPEIRLDSGMVLYSVEAVRKWLLMHQK